jgi:WD40 repeat protein
MTIGSILPKTTDIIPQNSPLSRLPSDIFLVFLKYLRIEDVQAMSLTCTPVYQMLQKEIGWKYLFFYYFPKAPIENKDYYLCFKNQYLFNLNAVRGIYSSENFPHRSRDGEKIGPFVIDNGVLYYGADFGVGKKGWIESRKLETKEWCALPIGHKGLSSLASWGDMIFTGSDDEKVKIWAYGAHFTTLKGHQAAIVSIGIGGTDNNILHVASKDGEISLWQLSEDATTITYISSAWMPQDLSSHVYYNDNEFVGFSNGYLYFYDNHAATCTVLQKFGEHPISSLAVCNDTLFSGHVDGTIGIWDLKSKKRTAALPGHASQVVSLAIYDGRLYSSSSREIKIWDFTTQREV